MGLQTKWINWIYSVATGSKRVQNVLTPVGAVFFCCLVVAFVALSLYLDRLCGVDNMVSGMMRILLSLPLFLIAVLLIGWSIQNFLRVKGTPVPFNPPPKLVTSGPYAYTRNPMLTGIFALLLGFGMFFGSVFLLFIFTPLFILLNYWELKTIEEPELVKRLGQAYVEYREKTPMFFPRLLL